MGNEYEEQAIEELYFRLIVKQTGMQIDKIKRAVRYANGIRVTLGTLMSVKLYSSLQYTQGKKKKKKTRCGDA